MKATKITNDEITDRCVACLPTRPTAPDSIGGRGYTASQMKSAFDRLPLHVIDRFNLLLEDIKAVGEDSLASEIKTGLGDGHSLTDLFSEIGNGDILARIPVGDTNLLLLLLGISERLSVLEERSKE